MLPTKKRLQQYNPREYTDNICPMCKVEQESQSHWVYCDFWRATREAVSEIIRKRMKNINFPDNLMLQQRFLDYFGIMDEIYLHPFVRIGVEDPRWISWWKGHSTASRKQIKTMTSILLSTPRIALQYIWTERTKILRQQTRGGEQLAVGIKEVNTRIMEKVINHQI